MMCDHFIARAVNNVRLEMVPSARAGLCAMKMELTALALVDM